jgi:hypothetical protein
VRAVEGDDRSVLHRVVEAARPAREEVDWTTARLDSDGLDRGRGRPR